MPGPPRIVCRGMMKRPRCSRKRRNCGLPVASAMLQWSAKSWVTASAPRLSAASTASKHSTILRICDAEARSAASPAASTSMPVRSSITSSTARSGDSGSTSMRSGRRAFSGTKAPTPWRVITSPSARKAATASRTTVRLTPVAAINSCSVGRRDPGGILPLVMSSVRRATSSLAKERGADSGWVTERLALLIPLTLGGAQSSYDMTSASMGLPPRSTGSAPAQSHQRLRRTIMNRRSVLRLGISALAALATDLGIPALAQQKLVLKATDVHPLGYPTVEAVLAMGRKLEAATGGRISIQMYPSMQLGGEKEMIEQAQVGALAIARISVGPMGPLVPELNVFNLPFIFRDDAHMEQVIDGPIGDELLKKLSDHPTAGLIGLCWMNAGTRNVYNSKKPVRSIDDLKGLKIRMMGNPVFVDTMNALGGNGVAMGYDQLMSALQTGVVDGAENNYPSYDTGQHYRLAKYYSLTGHLMIPEILIFSKRTWASLSKEDQALILKSAKEAQLEQRKLWYEMEQKSIKHMQEAGAEIVDVPDKKPFVEAVKPVWDKYGAQHAALIKRVQEVE